MSHLLKNGQMLGTSLASVQLSDFMLGVNHYEPEYTAPDHAHERADFCLIIHGGCHERSGRVSHDLETWTLAFHPSSEGHVGYSGPQGARCFHLELGQSWIDRLGGRQLLPKHFTHFRGGDLVWLAVRLYREFREEASFSPLIAEGLVLEMLGVLEKSQRHGPRLLPPKWFHQIIEILHEEMADQHTVNGIAQRVGVHPIHLTRIFRRFKGLSVGDYLQQLRIREACRLLTSDQTPLATIAGDIGFADQSHFTKIFKKWTGSTPLRFRALNSGLVKV